MSETGAERADKHDSLQPLLAAMFKEFQDAAKKKPEAALNLSKVRIVNRLLKEVFTILDGEPNRPYLDMLNEDDLTLTHTRTVGSLRILENSTGEGSEPT